MTTRREFLERSAASSAALLVAGRPATILRSVASSLGTDHAPKSLKILILGGTGLTGPHQVRYALARGHKVAVFNRGRRNDKLAAGVTQLIGDRNKHETDALRGSDWDAVIDNPVSLPFWVRDAAQVLEDHTKQYVFISTISVYDTKGQTSIDERSPLLEYHGGDPLAMTDEQFFKNMNDLYGPMKTASEREAVKWFGNRTTIVRPTLIVGPGDGSFRFTYWPYRIAKGGEILAPGDGNDLIQIIDARDVAEWTIRLVEEGTTGVFNAAGPRSALTMAEQLYGIRGAFDGNKDVKFTWVPADFLEAHKVSMWQDMPTWVPKGDSDYASTHVANARAVAAGLTFRPLATSAVEALTWFNSTPAAAQAQMLKGAGLPPEREQEVLAAWHASGK
ncbi:MAG: NAD-dependent epimerase/dehydratase family protein [Gemmatimonadaceae bacterium]